MLVMLMNDQLISPQTVCQGCLMANQQGQPRWQRGKLLCGRTLKWMADEVGDRPTQYECQMGFRIADID
ncbi:MAG: hypothetical protein F6K16_35170 [Symploca sp. SIO2B6]|nr:hypothetical protein [Symploca sp. SIO2B6]